MKELPDFSTGRVLVLGDVMMDRYWHGPASRISPEAPVPVVRVEQEEFRPGGAGNVALNITALGGLCLLMGLTGDDEMARALDSRLQEYGVDCRFERLAAFSTITKLRILSRHQQLIRLDFEDGFPGYDAASLLENFLRLLPAFDVVILSDYGKGTLHNPQAFIQAAREAGKPVLVDPKGKDFGKYAGATLITPNLHEFETVAGACETEKELEERGERMVAEYGLDGLLITRGEQGMTLLEKGRLARHMPTRAREVFDVTGAGDTVIATLAAGLATGMPLEAATHMANAAAGVVVGKLGTATVSSDELYKALHDEEAVHRGVVDEEHLVKALVAAKARGETIVLTNGCFDILHAGHVTYLEEAGKLGERLVVAVNVDETVRALKGKDRPVNSVSQRMRVLAALGCVDWVVPFAEETPERLICRLKPDFLVKGGDNDPEMIPGAACVREAGGQVLALTYVNGVSTTQIVRSIREK
ncbi:MAG: bifunctional D-glycero-beta-D-manno-heptose-7-phosphate kinase/D-glycero-beta-D-manno-heptose 1-phosphate adenylyltransferase HldE [Gammaproteobacteria bacterium]|nr:bifunctional D-glycero-beta-D-manno-heptose-7-phosphate kinase/D-glycero-beta-D-manno-heptose 1-phosphate adenylyltransferase HldE [Gammaproteobacteria bacterium]MBU1656276.1 bifunctional D-glycero-beta-D-manno-heptose-7-phosphate kinase/D-glycero-beta-D-manno-heptose 1-phosphate adenylyltransferase HldE [Gammaproteobacteria bacterium]MBU1959841.1 bifunctional D-glycero-beta-D-manno-heptose-7-phosphate kinase/D-glycero-beta-D-manno-heptose 1-phosphate adenylyltransferase HldE [Gammaproteobacte